MSAYIRLATAPDTYLRAVCDLQRYVGPFYQYTLTCSKFRIFNGVASYEEIVSPAMDSTGPSGRRKRTASAVFSSRAYEFGSNGYFHESDGAMTLPSGPAPNRE